MRERGNIIWNPVGMMEKFECREKKMITVFKIQASKESRDMNEKIEANSEIFNVQRIATLSPFILPLGTTTFVILVKKHSPFHPLKL